MTDQQHGAATLGPDFGHQGVKVCNARLVEALGRLVQDQDIRVAQQRAGQQNPLTLTAGQGGQLARLKAGHSGTGQRGGDVRRAVPGWQRQEPRHRHRQGCVQRQRLRHIADPQSVAPCDPTAAGRNHPQQRFQQGRFAGPVRTDQRHDLARCHGHVDAVQHRQVAVMYVQIMCTDQGGLLRIDLGIHRGTPSHAGHWPTASRFIASSANPIRPAAAVIASPTARTGVSATA